MEKLVSHLMSLFAVAMQLPAWKPSGIFLSRMWEMAIAEATAFDEALQKHCSSMRAILYPELQEAIWSFHRSNFSQVASYVGNFSGVLSWRCSAGISWLQADLLSGHVIRSTGNSVRGSLSRPF